MQEKLCCICLVGVVLVAPATRSSVGHKLSRYRVVVFIFLLNIDLAARNTHNVDPMYKQLKQHIRLIESEVSD